MVDARGARDARSLVLILALVALCPLSSNNVRAYETSLAIQGSFLGSQLSNKAHVLIVDS